MAEINITLKIGVSMDGVITTPEVPTEPENPPSNTGEDSLTKYGGQSYFRMFDGNISIEGKRILSQGLFKPEDVGKKFLGFASHSNPSEKDGDKYYPSIAGSRYATITKYISENELEVDFEFNKNSQKGYIFFDNSEAWSKMLDNENDIILNSGAYYCIPNVIIKALNKDKDYSFSTTEEGKAILQFGIEDYFNWSVDNPEPKGLFFLGDGDNNFISKNVVWASAQRFVKEADPFRLLFFVKQSENPTKARIIHIEGNIDNPYKFNESTNTSIALGFHYSGNTENYNVTSIKDSSFKGVTIADIKANRSNKIFHLAQNIDANYNPDDFARYRFKTLAKIVEGEDLQKIKLVNSDYSFYNMSHLFIGGWNNRASLAQIDRFTFWLPYQDRRNVLSNWYGIDKDSIFTGNTHYIDSIPKKGNKYWISREYQMSPAQKVPFDIFPQDIRSIVNWSVFQNKSLTEAKALDQFPIELQVGDKFKIVGSDEVYTITFKDRGDGMHLNWLHEINWFKSQSEIDTPTTYRYSRLRLDKPLPQTELAFEIEIVESTAEVLLDGQERDCWVVYKGSNYITQDINKGFGHPDIIQGNHVNQGIPYYNFSNASLYLKDNDFRLVGTNSFYRESGSAVLPDFKIHSNNQGLGGQWSNNQIGNKNDLPDYIKSLV